MDFPRTVAEITPQWLTDVLREADAIGDASVKSFSVSDIGTGQGISSQVARITPVYDGTPEDAPSSLITKLALPDDDLRSLVNRMGLYGRETEFYRHMSDSVALRCPVSYFAEHDQQSGFMNLLLQDVSHMRAVDQADTCSVEDASLALLSVAGMHTKWWNDDRLRGYSWIPGANNQKGIRASEERYRANFDSCFELLGDLLPIGFEQLASKVRDAFPAVVKQNSRPPLTLAHGDYRLGNLVFDDSDESSNSVVVFDWQGVNQAKAASDVSYFLCWSLDTANRRKHEKRLLGDYYDCLTEFGVGPYSYEQFESDVRSTALKLVTSTIMASAGVSKAMESEDGLKRVTAMCQRLQTLVDWNCEELIPG